MVLYLTTASDKTTVDNRNAAEDSVLVHEIGVRDPEVCCLRKTLYAAVAGCRTYGNSNGMEKNASNGHMYSICAR